MNQRIKELISKIAPSLALDELQKELEVSDTIQPHQFTCICDKCCSPCSSCKKKDERISELENTLSHLELRMARVYMEVTGGKCSKDTPASSVIALYGEHLNECINGAIDLETKPLVERIQQFDDHITTVANYLGAVCGGVDVGTNIPGSTAFEIIKKIKEIETQRDSILLKTEKMLESLDAINKIIFGETIVLGPNEYFKIRELVTQDWWVQPYVKELVEQLQDKIYQKAIDAIRDVQPVPIERPDQSVLIPPLTVRDFVQAIVNLKNDKRQ